MCEVNVLVDAAVDLIKDLPSNCRLVLLNGRDCKCPKCHACPMLNQLGLVADYKIGKNRFNLKRVDFHEKD
jgi:hypothetical protein